MRFAYVPTSQASSLTRLDNNMMMIITLWKIQTAISSFCSLIWALNARMPYTHWYIDIDTKKPQLHHIYTRASFDVFLQLFFSCWSMAYRDSKASTLFAVQQLAMCHCIVLYHYLFTWIAVMLLWAECTVCVCNIQHPAYGRPHNIQKANGSLLKNMQLLLYLRNFLYGLQYLLKIISAISSFLARL